MTSPKLQILERQMSRRSPERTPVPVETSDLGAAIERLIQERVDAALAEERERKPPPRVRDLFNAPEPYTSFQQIPPTPRAVAPKAMEATIERDGAGLSRAMVVNGKRFLMQRDGAGQLVRVVSEDLVNEVTYNGKPVPPPNRGD